MVDLDASMALVLGRRRIPFPKLMARLVTDAPASWRECRFTRPGLSTRPARSPAQRSLCTVPTRRSSRSTRHAGSPPPSQWPHGIEVPDARHTDVVDRGGVASFSTDRGIS